MSGITQDSFSPLTPDPSPPRGEGRIGGPLTPDSPVTTTGGKGDKPGPQRVVGYRRVWLLVVVAAAYAGLNAPKPPHIDDAAYASLARQFATRPLDPYGFSLLWYDTPDLGNYILAPPVLPASWGAAIALVGDRPWLCKLLLAPWALLLAWALDGLFRRFAPGMEAPLLVLTVFSPALLPSLNLMLDVPALALALAAVRLFLGACDRDSFGRATAAGLVAGLAMQTKYTAFLAPAVMLAAAALQRRWRLWPPAVLAAVGLFVAWEFLMAVLYGDSHFLVSLQGRAPGSLGDLLREKSELLLVQLPEYLGGLLPAVGVLGLAALGVSRRWLAAAAAAVLGGFAALTFLGSGDVSKWPREFLAADAVCSLFSLGILLVLLAATLRLFATDAARRRDTLFLLLWLGLEVLGYFALSPNAAVRRLLGIAVLLTLLVGRLAARTCISPSRRRTVWGVALGGAGLGLAFAALDLREARVQQAAAEDAAAWVGAHGGGRVWYVGHWGFQYAAEHCGMLQVVPQYLPYQGYLELPGPSRLHAGDWVVVPKEYNRVHRQNVSLSTAPLEPAVTLAFEDPVPLRTVWCYYLGRVPVERHAGPRLEVDVYRVTDDFTFELNR